MKNILEVKNIGKKYQNKEDEIQALKNVNFRIKILAPFLNFYSV